MNFYSDRSMMMKRCVTGSAGDDYYVRMYPRLQTELEGAIDQCMQTSQERKLYGKFIQNQLKKTLHILVQISY